jgi:aspartate-semialdehyde dehydrogenase
MKMVKETAKIMRDDTIRITSTTVRIPVMGGHSESVMLNSKTIMILQSSKNC